MIFILCMCSWGIFGDGPCCFQRGLDISVDGVWFGCYWEALGLHLAFGVTINNDIILVIVHLALFMCCVLSIFIGLLIYGFAPK